jgi:UDP-glucose 4-epimerase
MKNKKILITGGAGFIGSHLSERLSKNNKVIVLDKLLKGNKILNKNKNIKFIYGDVKDYSLVLKISKGCDIIFHLAALLGVEMVAKDNVLTMDTEFIGMRNICRAALSNNIKKIAYASSSGVYGQLNYEKNVTEISQVTPSSAYALSKKFNEIYLENMYKQYGLMSVSFRFFNVYGPRQDDRMVIPRFYNQCLLNKDITVYDNGKQTRDFTYIDDCIYSMIEATKKKVKYEVFNIARGADKKIIDIAKILKKMTGSRSRIIHVKVPKKLIEFQVKKRCGNSNKLKKFIKYKPHTSILDGLKKTYIS